MAEYNTVEELFARLGSFLTRFETKSYLVCTEDEHLPLDQFFDNTRYIKRISDHIYGFRAKEALPVVKDYIHRIGEILLTLEPIKKQQVDFNGVKIWEPIDEKTGIDIMNRYKRELKETLDYLKQFEDKLSRQVSMVQETQPAVNTPANVISLPENLTIKQITQAGFEPKLDRDTATLFLHYLREQEILPNYNNSSLGKLAEYFFARHQKYIKDKLSEAYNLTKDKEKLKIIQAVLGDLLKQVQDDLKKAH